MRYVSAIFLAATLLIGCGDDGDGEEQTTEVVAPSGPADTSLPGDPVAGEAIYTANCVACHGADGRGNGGVGGDFVGETERLAQDNAVLLAKIENGIQGNRVMPPQRDFTTEQERKDVLSYIRATFGGQE